MGVDSCLCGLLMKIKVFGIMAVALFLLSVCTLAVVTEQGSDGYESPIVGEVFTGYDGNEYRFTEVEVGKIVEFSKNKNLSGDVTIPTSAKDFRFGPPYPVRGIGAGAFMDSSIRTVDLTTVEWIDTAAFMGSTIESLHITSNLKWIAGNIILECGNFNTLTFDDVDNLSVKSDHVFCSMTLQPNGSYSYDNYYFEFSNGSRHIFTNDTVKLFSDRSFKWNNDEMCFEELQSTQDSKDNLSAPTKNDDVLLNESSYVAVAIGVAAVILILFVGTYASRNIKK